MPRTLVWFRSDLRVGDHPALHAAAARGEVTGLFLLAWEQWREHDWGQNRVRYLLDTLRCLAADLAALGIPLRIEECPRFADAPAAVLRVAEATGCDRVDFDDEYEWNERQRDAATERLLWSRSIAVHRHTDQVLFAPGSVRTGGGGYYSVFTPFRRACLKHLDEVPGPLPVPAAQGPAAPVATVPPMPAGFPGEVSDLSGFAVGEAAGLACLESFAAGALHGYDARRDFPAVDGTSRLSPLLACGALSTRQCLWQAAQLQPVDRSPWITELLWREFYRHVLFGFPAVSRGRPFRPQTDRLPWRDDPDLLAAWREGRTGVPIVDAAMRQLRRTGWMHNRLRMIAAMFLSKNLFVDWRLGEREFMHQLVDGDLASNNGGWQWSASTGTDAAPYFRVFNPTRQSERFDPDGAFIRAHVPELAGVEGPAIHDPARLPPLAWGALDYPAPLVDLGASRLAAIAHFKAGA